MAHTFNKALYHSSEFNVFNTCARTCFKVTFRTMSALKQKKQGQDYHFPLVAFRKSKLLRHYIKLKLPNGCYERINCNVKQIS